MIQRGSITEPAGAYPASDPPPATVASGDPLEQRVHRLEDAVAELQDTRALEDRVIGRVVERIALEQSVPSFRPAVEAERVYPRPLVLLPAPRSRGPWILFDLIAECQATARMFFDARYRVSRAARWVPLIALALVVLSYFLVGAIWVVGPWLDKAVDIGLAVFVYKILSREVACYRDALGGVASHRGS